MINRAQIFSVSFFIGLLIFFYAVYESWESSPIYPFVATLFALSSTILVHVCYHGMFEVKARRNESYYSAALMSLFMIWILVANIRAMPQYGPDETLIASGTALIVIGTFIGLAVTPLFSEYTANHRDNAYIPIATWCALAIFPWLVEFRGDSDGYFMAFFGFWYSLLAFLVLLYLQVRVGLKWQSLSGYIRLIFLASMVVSLPALMVMMYILVQILF